MSPLALTLFLFAAEPPAVEETPEPPPAAHRLSISANPLPFFLQGYDIGLGYMPAPLPHLRFYLTHHALGNGSAEWVSRVRAYTANGQYFFKPDGSGWFLGAQVALTFQATTRPDTPGEVADTRLLTIGAAGGYRWFPFSKTPVAKGLFVMPWLRAAVNVPLTPPATIGGVAAPSGGLPVTPLLHLGYELAL